jgi:formyltetrahydrofolate deformylase
MPLKKVAKIYIAGPDRKGIIATVTQFLFKNQCNIEDIDQRIHKNYLIMNMIVEFSALKTSLAQFSQCLDIEAKKMGCQSRVILDEKKKIKNVVALVTKESHCLQALIEADKKNQLGGKLTAVISNYNDLKPLALKNKLPFHFIASTNRKNHETKVLDLLDKYDTDLVILARYMQILSPDFVFRYEGRIINIHPSLLPAFPGPRSYHQAYNKGVEIAGVTTHFVTTDLDEGPIITQESYAVKKGRDTPETMIAKGRVLEAKALVRAAKLFLAGRLVLRRGKALDTLHTQKTALDESEISG